MPIQFARGTDQIGYLAPPNEAGKTSVVTASTTAAEAPTLPSLPNRRTWMIYNNGSVTVHVGFASNVTSSGATTGIPVPAGTSLIMDLGPDIKPYVIAASSTAACIITELA